MKIATFTALTAMLFVGLSLLFLPVWDQPCPADDNEKESQDSSGKADSLAALQEATARIETRSDTIQVERQSNPKGKRERRMARIDRWIASLPPDMAAVHAEHGFPASRHREKLVRATKETWSYQSKGLRFVFVDGKLTRTEKFPPTSHATK